MRNYISHITNQQGERLENHEDMERELIDHFSNVHQEPPLRRHPAIDQISHLIPKIITEEHNQMLLRSVSLQEVEAALAQTKIGKAPGPDDFTSNFFHHFWDLINIEV